jgi:predicted HicB family RNase H-like nuclease
MLTISEDKCMEVFEKANALYTASPDWATYFKQVMGVEGIIRKSFPIPQDLEAFEKSDQYQEIQEMLAKLREKAVVEMPDQEPTKVITVRLPKCLHESLRSEAHERKTSMNKLCISKLLQIIDGKLVPADTPSSRPTLNVKPAAHVV